MGTSFFKTVVLVICIESRLSKQPPACDIQKRSTKKSACVETIDPSPLAPHAGQYAPAGCWQDPSLHLAHQSDIRKSDRAQGCARAASASERETSLHL